MPLIPQSKSSYNIHPTCQIENLGWLLEQLPAPFGIFDPNRKGRLAEVGAFDGITYSNFSALVDAGWPTILIEPVPDNVALCRKQHLNKPWVIIEPVAVGASDGLLPMMFEREGSRFDGQSSTWLPMTTLNAILEKHKWAPDFDMLVIDAEGYEQPVLQGFDLEHYRPKLVIVETYGWQRAIIKKRFDTLYRVFSEDGLNTLFVRKDWSS